MGCKKLSDLAHAAKLSLVQRYEGPESYAAAVMSSLLGRCGRGAGVVGPEGIGATLLPTCAGWWASSLLEWLDCHDLSLHFVGQSLKLLNVKGSASDLFYRGLGVSFDRELPTSSEPVLLRAGQCWHLPMIGADGTNLHGGVCEVTGINGNLVNILFWDSGGLAAPEKGDILKLSQKSPSGFQRGAGTKLVIPIEAIRTYATNGMFTMYYLSPERHSKVTSKRKGSVTRCTILEVTQKVLRFWIMPRAAHPEVTRMASFTGPSVYTDASFKTTGDLRAHLYNRLTSSSVGAVVTTDDHVTFSAAKLVFSRYKPGAELTETITATLGLLHGKAGGQHFSDCKKAIGHITAAQRGVSLRGPSRMVTAALRRRSSPPVKWQAGHPEKGPGKNREFTDAEKGIFLADMVASDRQVIELAWDLTTSEPLNGDKLLDDLLGKGNIQLREKSGRPSLRPIMEVVMVTLIKSYTRTRDANRADRDLPPRWEHATYEWAARMHGLKANMSIDVRISRLRALWDKHYHGANLLLIGADEEVGSCKLCGGLEDQYHIIRTCTHPDMVRCRQRHISVIGGLLRDKYKNDPALPYLRCYTQMAFSLDTDGIKRHSNTAWTGMLHPDLADKLTNIALPEGVRADVVFSHLATFCKSFATGCNDLFRTRATLLKALRGTVTRAIIRQRTPHRNAPSNRRLLASVPTADIRPFTTSQESSSLLTRRRWVGNRLITD